MAHIPQTVGSSSIRDDSGAARTRHLPWNEWAARLAEIKRAQAAGDPDTGETYYSHWLNTLEKLVAEKGVTTPDTLTAIAMPGIAPATTPAWRPIELRDEDFV